MTTVKLRKAIILLLTLSILITAAVPAFFAFADDDQVSVEIFSFDEGATGETLIGPNKFAGKTYAEYQSDNNFITEGNGSVKKSTYYLNANINNIAFSMNKTDLGPYTKLTLDFYITDIDIYNEFWDGHFYLQLFGEGAGKDSAALYSAPFSSGLKEGWNELNFEINTGYYSALTEVAAFRICVDGDDSTYTDYWKESGSGMYKPSKGANTVFYYDNLRASGTNPYYGVDLGGETVLDFEEGEDVAFYPSYVPGVFGFTTDFKNHGDRAFRRDIGARPVYNNMFQFSRTDGSAIDLSGADVLAIDFYIGNIAVYREYWENHIYIMLAECGYTIKSEETTYQKVALPSGLQQGWNLIEINLNELELDLSNIGAIRFTPSDAWTNEFGYVPDSSLGSKADLTIGIDNIRKISDGQDVTAPSCGSGSITLNSVTGTSIGIIWPQFSDNYTMKDKIVYEIYANEEPLNSELIKNLVPGCVITGALGGSVTALKADTSYYFAVKATDEAGNSSVIYSYESYKTLEFEDSRRVSILSCEEKSGEDIGPKWVADGTDYNTEIKTEGKASISNVLSQRQPYYNMLIGYRTNSPIDVNGCNVLRMDFYIDDIEQYRKFWSGKLYVLVSSSETSQYVSEEGEQYVTYPIPTELEQGWNTLEFRLDSESIDLSSIWTVRISTISEWINYSPFLQNDPDCKLLVAFDNVRAEYVTVERDKISPFYAAGMLKAIEYSKTDTTLKWPAAQDSVTSSAALKYDVYLSDKIITEENINNLTPTTSVTGVNQATVTGLKPDTEYYYAVKVSDEAGNYALLVSDKSFKSGKEEKDFWKMIFDCDAESGIGIGPSYVPDEATYNYEIFSEGTSAIMKKIESRELWYNLILVEFPEKLDLSGITRITFDFYVDDIETFSKYWLESYHFVICDEYNSIVSCEIPDDIEEGWNTISFGVYGAEIDPTSITSIRLTPGSGLESYNTPLVPDEGESCGLTVGIDNIYAVYDSNYVPTVIEKNDDADSVIITDCDDIKEGGYWNNAVENDMFQKTEGAASVKHVFTNTFIRSNAFQYVSLELLNLNGAEELRFDLYLSNANLFKNRVTIGVMLTNSASAEEPYVYWTLTANDYLKNLQNGWNSISLPVSGIQTISVGFDWENVYMFRLYCIKSNFLTGESVDIRLDNIRMFGENIGKFVTSDNLENTDSDSNDYDYGFDDSFLKNDTSLGENSTTEAVIQQNSEPIKKITKNNVYHYLGYGAYVYILAIAAPLVCVGGIGAYFLITKLKKKKAMQNGGNK